ncbi:MAG TPA: amidohydrolase family protein [Steroidobacteraceae bacterium]|jgi:aminocarboxymuconate-semialdehyde decarboxylase
MHVDVHSHMLPESAFDQLPVGLRAEPMGDRGFPSLVADGLRSLGRPTSPALRDLDVHRERQRKGGVDVSIVGPWVDAVMLPLDSTLQIAWCRVINDSFQATFADQTHSRYLAALPDLDGAAAADELERSVSRGAVGGMLTTSTELGTLARRDFDALWSRAERLGVPLVLHPGTVEMPSRLRQNRGNILVGNPFETTLAAATLIAAGVPDRFPDLRVVLVHGGGFLPYQYGRVVHGNRVWNGLDSTRAPIDYARWFFYDSVVFEPSALSYLIDLVGVDHVLAGSDCPFEMSDHQYFLAPEKIGLDETETELMLGGNARALFKLDILPVGIQERA